jgi:hypothetical protein
MRRSTRGNNKSRSSRTPAQQRIGLIQTTYTTTRCASPRTPWRINLSGSNMETTFSMIKAKSGDPRAAKPTRLVNQALAGVPCRKIYPVVQSMFEFGIDPMSSNVSTIGGVVELESALNI